jgi:NAD(P)-dependent dehydrogenase (short-subunit alcohol dehydrogenase family)
MPNIRPQETDRPLGKICPMTGRLDGKVAIITGASTGLGPVLGSLFVREGARVLLAARREELVRNAAHVAGPGAIAVRADVTDEQGVDFATQRTKSLKDVALQDISSPEDVANLALFLASDESRTITGQSIPVDDGGYMQG